MKLHTVQMARWRLCKEREIPFSDITIKSGLLIFAPTWDMVLGSKGRNGAKPLTKEQYTSLYLSLMRKSFTEHKEEWIEFLSQEEVAIACYCKAGEFCHRYILAEVFKRLCLRLEIPFKYLGELKKDV